jgi:beta-lactamase superfamily II metal-dependent hydrolase
VLRVHFLNVGHGDCTFIEFPSGRKALIDINNSKKLDEETAKELYKEAGFSEQEASIFFEKFGFLRNYVKEGVNFVDPIDPIEDYLKPQGYLDDNIFRLIITHPDMDHMSGLNRLLQEGTPIISFWDTSNSKSVSKEDCEKSNYDYDDWLTYQELRKSEANPNCLHNFKGYDSYFYGFQELHWDKIRILSPTPEIALDANETQNWNAHSYILCIEYAGHKIMLGGDAEQEIWDDLAVSDSDLLKDVSILKAPHHGRKSGYSSKAVKIMNPLWTVCSVGNKADLKQKDGSSCDGHQNYRYYTQNMVLSTRYRGNIVVEITPAGELTVKCSHNAEPDKELYQL